MEVTHPDSAVLVYPLERLTKLYDGIEQLEDTLGVDDASDTYDVHSENGETWSMDEDGIWHPDANGDEWEDLDSGNEDEQYDPMEVDSVDWANESAVDEAPIIPPQHPISEVKPTGEESDFPWKRFDILPSAPHDHAFISSPPAQPSKSFLGRLAKEYRALASSLPGWFKCFTVRAYLIPYVSLIRIHHHSCI